MISLIIPTYNSSQFIKETISSAQLQTCNDIEIVIVDDGSIDNTAEIVSNMNGPVKIIRQQNKGRGAARNNGISQAKGEYIAFLDHDDLLFPESIADRVAFLESKPNVGWVFTDAIEFDATGDLRLYLDQFPWLDLSQDNFCQLLRGCFPLTSSVMIRSDLIRQVGGFNTAIDYGDDIELFLRLFLVSKVGMIRKPLTRRRIHAAQGVSNTFDRWDSRVKIYSNFKPSVGKMSEQQGKALKQALRFAYYKLGECYWERNDFGAARIMFLKSCGLARHLVKALLYAALCLAPDRFISMLRSSKHAISGDSIG